MKVQDDLAVSENGNPISRRKPKTPTPTEAMLKDLLVNSHQNRNFIPIYHNDVKDTGSSLIPKIVEPAEKYATLKTLLDNVNRTDDEAMGIYNQVKNIKFFNEIAGSDSDIINVSAMIHLCKKLQYCYAPAGTVVINHDEPFTKKIHIVLSGELNVIRRGNIQAKFGENDSSAKSRPSIFGYETVSTKTSNQGTHHIIPVKPQNRESVFVSYSKRSMAVARSNKDVTEEGIPKEMYFSYHPSTIESDGKTHILDPTNDSLITERNDKVIEKLWEGSYFGAKCSFPRQNKTLSIVAVTNAELIVFDKEDLEHIRDEIKSNKTQMLNFLAETLMGSDDGTTQPVLEEILHIADIRVLDYQRKVINEGEIGDEFHIIMEGECELMKTVIYDKSENFPMTEVKTLYGLNKNSKEEIKIASLIKGSFFGEEILFNEECPYEYSVKVTSEKAKLLSIKKEEFLSRCPEDKLNDLKHMSLDKARRNRKTVNEKLLKKGIQSDIDSLKNPKPTLRIPKNRAMASSSSFQGLINQKDISSIKNGEFDYVKTPQSLQVPTEITSVRQATEELNDMKNTYYIPDSKSKQVPAKPIKIGGYNSFMAPKIFFSCNNSPGQSKEGSLERKICGNTSFQSIKDINSNMTGYLERVKGFRHVNEIHTTELIDNKFDFGRSVDPKYKALKNKKAYEDAQAGAMSPLPQHCRNLELSSLITLKMKQLDQLNGTNKISKMFKDLRPTAPAVASDRSSKVVKGVNINRLKLTHIPRPGGLDDYKIDSISPVESSNSPKDSPRSKKRITKTKIKLGKIASNSPVPKKDLGQLPNIEINKFSPSYLKSRSEKTLKFLM